MRSIAYRWPGSTRLSSPVAAALFYQPNVHQLAMVYDSMSGEGVSASQQASFQSTDLFQTSIGRELSFWLLDDERNDPNAMVDWNGLDRAAAPGSDQGVLPHTKAPPAYLVSPPRSWRAWTIAYGGTANYPAEPFYVGSAGARTSGAGFASGLDYELTPNVLMGLAAGYGKFSFGVPNRETNGAVEGEHVAAYGAVREGRAYVTAMVGGDFFDNNETRHAFIPGTTLPTLFDTPIPSVPGFNENPGGKFGSNAISGAFEAGYMKQLGPVTLTPFVGLQYSVLRQFAFTESQSGGPSMLGLNFSSRTIPSIPTLAGLRLDWLTPIVDDMAIGGWVRAAWKHEFDTRRSTESAFLLAPGFDFTIEGARAVHDAARREHGTEVCDQQILDAVRGLRRRSRAAGPQHRRNGRRARFLVRRGGEAGFVLTWRPRQDSNLRPTASKAVALSS